jgi:hypothetical protein
MMVTERQNPLPLPEEEPPGEPTVSTQPSWLDELNPRLAQMIVNLSDDEVICPLRMKREDVHKVAAVKLSDEETLKVKKFQFYLFDRGYLKDNTFASLFVYLFDLAYTLHSRIANEEADEEERRG